MTTAYGPRLAAARTAVAQACRVARWVQERLEQTRAIAKADQSPVTVADFAVQAVVAHSLSSALGPVLLVGEENSDLLRSDAQAPTRTAVLEAVREVWAEASSDEVLAAIDAGTHDATAAGYWTLDPIDGTKGFLRRGQYAISLAYIDAGDVTLGVMGCPNLSADLERPFADADPEGLIFVATRGGGAAVNSATDAYAASLAVQSQEPHSPIRMCESVESGHSDQSESARVLERLGGGAAPARLDSQCKYAVVARGQADAYLRLPTRRGYVEHIWDHAAGMLIAQEAGAVVTDIDGRPLDFSCGTGLAKNRGIVCAARGLHGRIVEAIFELER